MVVFDDVKFGFEYETLIEVRNPLYDNLFLAFLELQKIGLFQRKSSNPECAITISANHKTLTRFLLAIIFDQIDTNTSFKATKGYHSINCEPFSLSPLIVKNRDNSWVITHDSSVMIQPDGIPLYKTFSSLYDFKIHQSTPTNYTKFLQCIEIVSPILLAKNIRNPIVEFGIKDNPIQHVLQDILPANESFVYWNNEKTSNHIHLSIDKIFQTNPYALLKTIMAWWYFEPLFLLIVGFWRWDNIYCVPLRKLMTNRHGMEDNLETWFYELGNRLDILKVFEILGVKDTTDVDKQIAALVFMFQGIEHEDRYAALNLHNVGQGGYGTIEVRLKQGSSSAEENARFMQLLGLFFVATVNNEIVTKIITNNIKKTLWEFYSVSDGTWTNIIKSNTSKLNDSVTSKLFDTLKNFIVKGNPNDISLCEDVFNYWNEFIQKMQNSTQFKQLGGKETTMYLFSYGSNNAEQLKKRLEKKHALPKYPACLQDHARIFAGYSKRWNGGVASIIEANGINVYGTVTKVTETDLEKLDKYEIGYEKQWKTVVLKNGEKVKAIVYVKEDNSYYHPPSESYLRAIHKTLTETDRIHHHKIMVRAINPKTKKVKVIGSWTPESSIILRE